MHGFQEAREEKTEGSKAFGKGNIMRKPYIAIIALTLLLCGNVYGKTEQEITFRSIPWGTSCAIVESQYFAFDFMHVTGDWTTVCSCNEVMYNNQFRGTRFDNNDINISASSFSYDIDEITVAGYALESINMYYAYTVSPDGHIQKSTDTSALYGAEYIFEPQDLYGMSGDIKEKLTSLYGEPDDMEEEKESLTGYLEIYTIWYGANNTKVVLATTEDLKPNGTFRLGNGLRIVYLWEEGDNLLQKASDAISNELKEAESTNYGNSNTDGL